MLKYRTDNYFNKDDYYLIIGLNPFVSKLEFDRGCWWTIDNLQYKASSVEMVKLNKLKQ